MVLPKETIASGAPDVCVDCKVKLKLEIMMSGGGYYIGTQCECGPYSRESEYYKTREQAKMALDSETFGR